ncbi:hypothetical protein HPNQ4216_1160 [Helicobacter pylori NQ4216]|nr:hypothetical protein HPNQ4216_1160 [Helicobacter pylori NQ4216]
MNQQRLARKKNFQKTPFIPSIGLNCFKIIAILSFKHQY